MFNKQIKTIILTALAVFTILAFTTPTTYAASSPVGVVNYQQLINQHPDMEKSNETYKAAVKQAQDDFNAKSASMNEDEKKAYSQQLEQGLQQKKQELLSAIQNKVNAAIKEVADSKKLTIIVVKNYIVYGGQDATDITDDVMKKITGK